MKHQGLDHFAIAVPSTEEALKVRRDRLGFPVVCSEVVNKASSADDYALADAALALTSP